MWKWIVGVVVVVLVGCVGGGVILQTSGQLKKWQEQFSPGMRSQVVRIETPRRGDLVRTISAPGSISPRTKVDISAQVSARIIALPFMEGQRVRKGDVLVKLDAEDLAAALDSSKARLASEEARLEGVKAALDNSDRELRRQRELLATKDISPSEFEQAETTYDQAKSLYAQVLREIDIAKANIKRSEKDLANTTIESPIDGVVSNRAAEVGELVVIGTLNNPGSVIMQVANLGDMLMKAKVDEANISPVQPGQKCRVTINAFNGKAFDGEVERIRPTKQLDKDGTSYFETEIRVDLPPDNQLSGMLANVDIEVETFRDVLKVPSQAVMDKAIDELPESIRSSELVDRSKKFARVVFRFRDGKVEPVPVSVGPSDLTDTVVTQGVSSEDRVVTGPFKALIALKPEQKVISEEEQKKLDEAKKGIKTADTKEAKPDAGGKAPEAGKS